MKNWFITFEGTEGSGKSTQIRLLAQRLTERGFRVREVREPGGTPIGEEIRHTLKHSHQNQAMTPEAELLLINASRAQLVREVIRPALAAGETVLSDRYYDSTVAYQAYGRRLDLKMTQTVIDLAVGDTRPDLTLWLAIPTSLSEGRRDTRTLAAQQNLAVAPAALTRDRFEEADRAFFERVEAGYRAIAQAEPQRVRCIDATLPAETVAAAVWRHVEALIAAAG
jgi:dTMP kinase